MERTGPARRRGWSECGTRAGVAIATPPVSECPVLPAVEALVDVRGMRTWATASMVRDERGLLRVGALDVQIQPETGPADAGRISRCLELFEDYCVVTGAPGGRAGDRRGQAVQRHRPPRSRIRLAITGPPHGPPWSNTPSATLNAAAARALRVLDVRGHLR